MEPKLVRQIDRILQYLDVGLGLCRRLGLPTGDTRFAQYRAWLQEFRLSVSARGVERAFRDAQEGPAETRIRYTRAITEGGEFASIAPFLEDCLATGRENEIGPKLEKVIDGPTHPEDEDENENEARNIQLELMIAAQYDRAGLQPVLGKNPDLACTVNRSRILIQCKRPFSYKRLARNISRAKTQLERDLQAEPAARGVVMISVANVGAHRHEVFAHHHQHAAADHVLDEELARIASQRRRGIAGLQWPIIGIDFVHSTSEFCTRCLVFDRVYRLLPNSLVAEGSQDQRLLDELYARAGAIPEPFPHMRLD